MHLLFSFRRDLDVNIKDGSHGMQTLVNGHYVGFNGFSTETLHPG